MMNKEELIAKLKVQHRELEINLHNALSLCDGAHENAGEQIHTELERFQNTLTEHLTLEDTTFYPEYFKMKIAIGEGVESTQAFFEEIKSIGAKVNSFLNTYNSPEAITTSLDLFTQDLKSITAVLRVRLETEEESVYEIFLLM